MQHICAPVSDDSGFLRSMRALLGRGGREKGKERGQKGRGQKGRGQKGRGEGDDKCYLAKTPQ